MNDNSGWQQPPGYRPGLDRQPTAFDVWPGLPPSSEPTRPRGNLLTLAFVVGLLAFFLADALPGGPSAIATFFVATATVLVLFLLAVAVDAFAGRVRRDAPRPFSPLPARGRRRPRAGVRVDVGWGSTQAASPAAAADVEEVTTPAPPGSKRHFLQVVDELLAVVDALPESEGREIQDGLLRFATSADVTDLAELVERRRVPELRRFALVAEQLPTSRLRYLAVVLRARKIVR